MFLISLFIAAGIITAQQNQRRMGPRGGGVLPYLGYIGMCRCEVYVFQAVYSRIGYINQNVWV